MKHLLFLRNPYLLPLDTTGRTLAHECASQLIESFDTSISLTTPGPVRRSIRQGTVDLNALSSGQIKSLDSPEIVSYRFQTQTKDNREQRDFAAPTKGRFSAQLIDDPKHDPLRHGPLFLLQL